MEDQTVPQDVSQDAPSKLVINGAEYDPTEVQSYIDQGKKMRELEQKWNTPIDSLMPSYTKATQENVTLRQELEGYKQQIATFQSKQAAGTETTGDLEKAREAARKLGLTLKEDLDKEGYIRKDQLDEYYTKKRQEEKEVEKILGQAEKLEKEFNGEDGRPKFRQHLVLLHAQHIGESDLKKAYEDLYKDELTSWQETQLKGQKRPGMQTISKSPGVKEPQNPKVPTDSQGYKDALSEALYG